MLKSVISFFRLCRDFLEGIEFLQFMLYLILIDFTLFPINKGDSPDSYRSILTVDSTMGNISIG